MGRRLGRVPKGRPKRAGANLDADKGGAARRADEAEQKFQRASARNAGSADGRLSTGRWFGHTGRVTVKESGTMSNSHGRHFQPARRSPPCRIHTSGRASTACDPNRARSCMIACARPDTDACLLPARVCGNFHEKAYYGSFIGFEQLERVRSQHRQRTIITRFTEMVHRTVWPDR